MNKIFKYKDYSPIEIGKMNENVKLDIVYEIRGVDVNGDEYIPPVEDDDYNYNPYDLKEVVKLLIIKNKKQSTHIPSENPRLHIVKVTTEKVPQDKLEQIRIEIEGDKYNL